MQQSTWLLSQNQTPQTNPKTPGAFRYNRSSLRRRRFLWKYLGARKNGRARGRHACLPRASRSSSRLASFSPISQLHHHPQVILNSLRVWFFLISSGGVIDSDSLTSFFADSKFHIPLYKESINDYPRLLFLGLLDHSISLWSLSVLKVNEGMGG